MGATPAAQSARATLLFLFASFDQAKTVAERIAAEGHRSVTRMLVQLFLLCSRLQGAFEHGFLVVHVEIHVDRRPMTLVAAPVHHIGRGH